MEITREGDDDKHRSGHGFLQDFVPLTAHDVDHYVSQIRPFAIKDIGDRNWMKQHDTLNLLNKQVHAAALTNSEGVFLEAFLSHDKIPVLIHELIVIQIWTQQILPKIKNELSTDIAKSFFLLYHESVILSILEIVFYHKEALQAAGDTLIEMVDYTYKKIVKLPEFSLSLSENQSSNASAKDILLSIQNKDKEFSSQRNSIEFSLGISSLTIVRFITDHISELSLSLLTRLLDHFDFPLALINLLQSPPWVKKEKVIEKDKKVTRVLKFTEGVWVKVSDSDMLKLVKPEIQVWLSIYNILLTRETREHYHFTPHRKSIILKLRSFLTETLIDQIPFLADLHRALSELDVMDPPAPTQKVTLIIEQIPEMSEKMSKGLNWDELVEYQKQSIFGQIPPKITKSTTSTTPTPTTKKQSTSLLNPSSITQFSYENISSDSNSQSSSSSSSSTNINNNTDNNNNNDNNNTTFSMEEMQRLMQNIDQIEQFLPPAKCAWCGKPAPKKCSRCKNEWYCERECQVKAWPRHKNVCDIISRDINTKK